MHKPCMQCVCVSVTPSCVFFLAVVTLIATMRSEIHAEMCQQVFGGGLGELRWVVVGFCTPELVRGLCGACAGQVRIQPLKPIHTTRWTAWRHHNTHKDCPRCVWPTLTGCGDVWGCALGAPPPFVASAGLTDSIKFKSLTF